MIELVKLTPEEHANRRKKLRRTLIIILTPLIITIIIFSAGAAYSAHTMRAHRAEIRAETRANLLYDFTYLLYVLEHNLPTMDFLRIQQNIDLMAHGHEILDTIYCPGWYPYFMWFWRILGSEFLGPLGDIHPTGNLRRVHEDMRRWMFLEYRRLGVANEDNMFAREPEFIYHNFLISLSEMQERTEMFANWRGTKIAYYNISFFSARITPTRCTATQNFFRDIQDAPHLIVDIRGVSGGATWFFDERIGRFLVAEETYANFHNFYMGGSHNQVFFDRAGELRPQSSAICFGYVTSLLANDYLHVLDYLARMQYHYVYRYVLSPHDTPYTFGGKVWILVDEYTKNAAHVAAAVYKDLGIATIVGNTTGGGGAVCSIAGTSNFVTLPNTGIIVRYDTIFTLSPNGRPVEYGVEPHYFNRPGKDALETVLALIEEGWYR